MIVRAWPMVSLAVLAVATAAVGTGVHRAAPYWGVAGAIVMILCSAVFARAWKDWLGLVLYGVIWVALVTAFAVRSDSGSILILADKVGYAWLVGGGVAIAAAGAVPRRFLEGPAHVASAT